MSGDRIPGTGFRILGTPYSFLHRDPLPCRLQGSEGRPWHHHRYPDLWDLVNFHPHLHALVADGVFTATGWFVAFPKIELYVLEHLFRHRVLEMLLRERRIDEAVIRTLLGWRHSRFSLHNAVRIGAHETEERRAVAEYILRAPFSLEKLRYHATTGTVLYHVG